MLTKYLFALCIFGSALAVQKSYDGYKVLEVKPSSFEQVDFLKSLEDHEGVMFWEVIHRVVDRPTRIMVAPDYIVSMQNLLEAAKVQFEIIIENYEEVLQKERKVNKARRELRNLSNGRALPDFTYFQTYEEIYDYISSLSVNYPDLVELEVLGQTLEGRDVPALKISLDGRVDGSRPIVFVDALIHAREWIAGSVCMKMIYELVENSANNLDILRNIDWIIVPVLNPDGYVHSHVSDRMWRKNRALNVGSICTGVDLNRNFNFQWDVAGGASNQPCSAAFRGPNPESEIETVLLSELLGRFDSTYLYMTLHSHGNYWLHPWGYDFINITNVETHREVGQRAVDALYAVNGNQYDLGNAADLLYIASGAADDYAAGPGNVPLVYTIELPGGGNTGFDIEQERIEDVVAETWPAIRECALFVAETSTN